MTIQRRPSCGWQPPHAVTPPPSIKRAVRVMCVGAVITAIFVIFAAVNTNPGSLGIGNPSTDAYHAGEVFGTILFAAVLAGLWPWMAWKNYRGRAWARVTSTVLFGFMSLYAVTFVIAMAVGAVTLPGVLIILQWCTGLAALVLIWSRESSQYYMAMRGQAAYAPVPPG